MKTTWAASIFASFLARAVQAQVFSADADTSRFVEKLYKTALPGMAEPAVYIELAKKAIKGANSEILFRQFSEPIVTYRIYRNAPRSDRDIIAVQFVYEGIISNGGWVGGGLIINRAVSGVPVLQALIRKDRSKVYLHVVKYKQ
jgi:hypothetical protein